MRSNTHENGVYVEARDIANTSVSHGPENSENQTVAALLEVISSQSEDLRRHLEGIINKSIQMQRTSTRDIIVSSQSSLQRNHLPKC
jgi:t-SNARE complex subunit (syntaxin)